MAQPEYKDIYDNNWDDVRYAIRRIYERLSVLEGYSGTSNKYSSTDMAGNKLSAGPYPQVKAHEDEFITKSYLRSQEAAAIFAGIIKSGGLSPINPTLLS